MDGSICVENNHAILETVKSSIRDSLQGKGVRGAVLNDEAHHVANAGGTEAKKWKEFLLNPEYGFRTVVGVSGTCYVGDDYFADVVSRYSLRQSIDEHFVKKVEYVAEMPQTNNPEEKWQLIYNQHQAWKKKLKQRGIRPLTIIVTKDIRGCEQVAEELKDFLVEWEKLAPEQANDKVLPVSSSNKHQANVAKLKLVDKPASKAEDVIVEFERAVTGEHTKFKTQIRHKTWSVADVAEQMFQRLKSIDEESREAEDPQDRTSYAKRFPLEMCEEIVRESLKRAKITTGRITDENRQKFLQALGTLRRKSAKRVLYKLSPNALISLNTCERQAESCSAAELRRGTKTVFYAPGCEATLADEQREFFREVGDPDGDFLAGRQQIGISSDFRTPANLVIADAMPERRFVRTLCERDNAKVVDAWVKNTPVGFYAIEYAWKKGEHPKRGEFSPDFFIKQEDRIFVVEIKGDEEISDPSPENVKKHEFAVAHFQRLNEWLPRHGISIRYQFNMLTPRDYGKFFTKLREGELAGFRSELDVAMAKATGATG
jgi:hypothetical protein